MLDSQLPEDIVHYDPDTGAYSVSYADCSVETVSMAVVGLIATLEDAATSDLEPLYESIDPEALDALFEPRPSARDSDVRLAFSYAGYEVTIDSDGQITAVSTD